MGAALSQITAGFSGDKQGSSLKNGPAVCQLQVHKKTPEDRGLLFCVRRKGYFFFLAGAFLAGAFLAAAFLGAAQAHFFLAKAPSTSKL